MTSNRLFLKVEHRVPKIICNPANFLYFKKSYSFPSLRHNKFGWVKVTEFTFIFNWLF